MNTVKLSVLMPVYQAARFLREALESVLAQTFADFEIVAVDDGSGDGSGAILAEYAARDRRVRVLSRPHQGLVAALNAGLAACRGALVARFDADDIMPAHRFAAQVEALDTEPDLGVVGALVEGFGEGGLTEGMRDYLCWLNALTTPEAIARERFVESPLAHPSVMLRRALLCEVGGYRDTHGPEDYDLWLRLLARGVRMRKVPEVLLYWRDHDARATRVGAAYTRENLRRCKLVHLLSDVITPAHQVLFCGAGIEGKPILRGLTAAGVRVSHVAEVDARKIGNVIHGARVVPFAELGQVVSGLSRPLVLAGVGVAAARAVLRRDLEGLGLREGVEFWLCA